MEILEKLKTGRSGKSPNPENQSSLIERVRQAEHDEIITFFLKYGVVANLTYSHKIQVFGKYPPLSKI